MFCRVLGKHICTCVGQPNKMAKSQSSCGGSAKLRNVDPLRNFSLFGVPSSLSLSPSTLRQAGNSLRHDRDKQPSSEEPKRTRRRRSLKFNSCRSATTKTMMLMLMMETSGDPSKTYLAYCKSISSSTAIIQNWLLAPHSLGWLLPAIEEVLLYSEVDGGLRLCWTDRGKRRRIRRNVRRCTRGCSRERSGIR